MLEVMATAALGVLLVWISFGVPDASQRNFVEPEPLDETPKGLALIAIKELEFDRETGKIAEEDYRDLRDRLAKAALAVMDPLPEAGAAATPIVPGCPRCGPRPERTARFCSTCGGPVSTAA